MEDLRFDYKNNQKKASSVSASGIIKTSSDLDALVFTLPEASLVTRVSVVVLEPSGVDDSTIDVTIDGMQMDGDSMVAFEEEVKVDDEGTIVGTNSLYFETGGEVKVVAGDTEPDTAGRLKLIVEYIETEVSSGTYTD